MLSLMPLSLSSSLAELISLRRGRRRGRGKTRRAEEGGGGGGGGSQDHGCRLIARALATAAWLHSSRALEH